MAFETVPVVHLDRGRFPEYPRVDPELVLTRLSRAYGRVAVIDVQGVRANDADLEFIQRASRKRSLWVDAGSRYATDAMDLFVAGAEWVTMRWNTLHDVAELAEAASLAQEGALFVALEFPNGQFLAHPKDKRSAADAAALAASLGVGVVYVADAKLAHDLPPASASRFFQNRDARPADLQAWGYEGALVGPLPLDQDAPS